MVEVDLWCCPVYYLINFVFAWKKQQNKQQTEAGGGGGGWGRNGGGWGEGEGEVKTWKFQRVGKNLYQEVSLERMKFPRGV